MRDDLLRRVRKPIQYADGEVNAVRKPPDPGRTVFALAFPDTYELGMSHQGLKILYHILNGRPDVSAERVFVPEADMEEILGREGLPLATLESGTPLSACHFVGFTLQSELHYTNILNMLHLGGVPIAASERGPGDPFVIGGGPQALNPEPLADFFDAFVLGDGEEVVLEIVDAFGAWRRSVGARGDFLARLAGIPGVYVPSLYRVAYREDGTLAGVEPAAPGVPARVARRLILDLDRCPIPESSPVPYMETTHDRLTVEVARGCIRGCRFCHAGMIYRPYRERSLETVKRSILDSLARTGYDEVSLSALSSGDYSCLAPLVSGLARLLKPRYVSISLPSIRPGSLPDDVIRDVGSVRKSSFTIAPEAGSDRLRRVINKGITEAEILSTAEYIFRNGWKALKLYFMIGLPGERPEDIEAVEVLAKKIKQMARDAGVKHPQVTVSVSSYVPKPHTPFQWCSMAGPERLAAVIDDLSHRCRRSGIQFKWHQPSMSVVEGLLSRGDRRLGRVVRRVWERGGRSEAWTDRFDFNLWREALAAEGLEIGFYTQRAREENEVFPWDHLDARVSRDFLLRERRRGLEERETEPCRIGACRACGACPEGVVAGAPTPPAGPRPEEPPPEDRRFRVRLRFRKVGLMKFLSHLELFRAFYRAARRANLPLSYSGGYNPHPRISFAPPLPVGIEGEGELVDMELAAPYPLEQLRSGLNATFPAGLEITEARYVPAAAPALFEAVEATLFRVDLPGEITASGEEMDHRLREILGQETLMVERESGGKKKRKNVRPFIRSVELKGDGPTPGIDLWLAHTNDGTIRPSEFLALLFPGEGRRIEEFPVRRVGLYRLVMDRPVDAFLPPAPGSLKGAQR